MGVTICGEHLEHAAAELKDRDIKRTSTEVEHGNLHVFVGFVDAVGERCRSRLVDDTHDVESCYLSGLFGCLTL